MNSRRSIITTSWDTTTTNIRNHNSNGSRRLPNTFRGRRLPGPIIPGLLVPESSSSEIKKSRRSSDCVIDALAVMRSTKRRRSSASMDDDQQHQRDNNPKIRPQTPRSDPSPTIAGPEEETKRRHSDDSSSVADDDHPMNRTDGSWEWSIGILPPAPSSEHQQHQNLQNAQFSRITPVLYPRRVQGCSAANVTFFPGSLPVTMKGKRHNEFPDSTIDNYRPLDNNQVWLLSLHGERMGANFDETRILN